MPFSGGRESAGPAVAKRVAVIVVCAACSYCAGAGPVGPGPGPVPSPTPIPLPTPGPEIFVGAGDIAIADGKSEDTSRLLDTIGGLIFTLGDNAYPNGSRDNYRNVYDRSWGRHLGRTRPTPGNHEYVTPGAAAYFEYFGEVANAPLGYYAFDHGAWRVLSLNSNAIEPGSGVSVAPNSLQGQFLQSELTANTKKCLLAYWHHPLFSSGRNGDNPWMREFYRMLYNGNADVVLTGHDHLYERFAPQDADGRNDAVRGIREFVVGTGGVMPLYNFPTVKANSEVRINDKNGVLKLTLLAESYQWEFITAPNGVVADSGTGTCH